MHVCTEALKKKEMTEFEAFAVSVARKLEKMDPIQALHAETIIHTTLRKGLLKQLTENTDICDKRCNNIMTIRQLPASSLGLETQEHIIPPSTPIINFDEGESENILRDYYSKYKDCENY